MRILITGSRTWDRPELVSAAMVAAVRTHARRRGLWHGPATWVTVVHGACPNGADQMAHDFALKVDWTIERHPANWDKYGKRAGFVRNADMVNLGADVCLAFIRDGSRGASMTADLAEKAGIPTVRVPYPA